MYSSTPLSCDAIARKSHAMGNLAMCHLVHGCESGTVLSDLGHLNQMLSMYMIMLLRQLI